MANDLSHLPPEQITSLILSYGDANLVASAFSDLGWSFNEAIRETLFIARQNKNLAAKLNAIKHLHDLVREAAEASGYLAKVSRTVSAEDGSQMTFSARRIAGALNPPQKQSPKENDNEEAERDRIAGGVSKGPVVSAGNEGGRLDSGGTPNNGRTDGGGDNASGGVQPENGGDARDAVPGGSTGERDDACVDQRPPTCRQDLYPGVSPPTGE